MGNLAEFVRPLRTPFVVSQFGRYCLGDIWAIIDLRTNAVIWETLEGFDVATAAWALVETQSNAL